jgi:hypothetical protein
MKKLLIIVALVIASNIGYAQKTQNNAKINQEKADLEEKIVILHMLAHPTITLRGVTSKNVIIFQNIYTKEYILIKPERLKLNTEPNRYPRAKANILEHEIITGHSKYYKFNLSDPEDYLRVMSMGFLNDEWYIEKL